MPALKPSFHPLLTGLFLSILFHLLGFLFLQTFLNKPPPKGEEVLQFFELLPEEEILPEKEPSPLPEIPPNEPEEVLEKQKATPKEKEKMAAIIPVPKQSEKETATETNPQIPSQVKNSIAPKNPEGKISQGSNVLEGNGIPEGLTGKDGKDGKGIGINGLFGTGTGEGGTEKPLQLSLGASEMKGLVDKEDTNTLEGIAITGVFSKGGRWGRRGGFVLSQLKKLPIAEVKPGSTQKLAAAKQPFLDFIRTMHKQIHEHWVDDTLKDFQTLQCGSPFNDLSLAVTIEIVIRSDGTVEKAVPFQTSGFLPFDAAAIAAVYDGGPYPEPSKKIRSYNDKVYLHWTIHRDERQCGSAYAEPFLLADPETPQDMFVAETPLDEAMEAEQPIENESEKPEAKKPKKLLGKLAKHISKRCFKKVKKIAKMAIGKTRFCKRDGIAAAKGFALGADLEMQGFDTTKSSSKASLKTQGGPLDEISFPPKECANSCMGLCFQF